jgi:hypothetical protein
LTAATLNQLPVCAPCARPYARQSGGFELVSYYNYLVEIHSSARKHGISDEDIDHATTHASTIKTTTPASISAEP